MSIREKDSVLLARLTDVENEIADMEARPVICRDIDLLTRLYVQRTIIKRDIKGSAA